MRRLVVLLLFLRVVIGSVEGLAQDQDRATLRIVTWNTTRLGDPSSPPADDRVQVENVARVIRELGADVYALQEVASPEAFSEVISLVAPEYAGLMTDARDLRFGLIYRTDDVGITWASDELLEAHAFDFGGRPPLFASLDLKETPENDDILLAIVHLKAFADDVSYERRLRAVELLKAAIDESSAAHTITAGDFNDFLFRSITEGRDSPLRAFRVDSLRYFIPTALLERNGLYTFCATSSCEDGSVLDHYVLSADLSSWEPVVQRLEGVLERFPGFVSSTSDHLPVELTLRLPDHGNSGTTGPVRLLSVYPNPFSTTLDIRYDAPDGAVTFELVDALGRVWKRTAGSGAGTEGVVLLSGNGLPAGVYLLRVRIPSSSVAVPVVHVR